MINFYYGTRPEIVTEISAFPYLYVQITRQNVRNSCFIFRAFRFGHLLKGDLNDQYNDPLSGCALFKLQLVYRVKLNYFWCVVAIRTS